MGTYPSIPLFYRRFGKMKTEEEDFGRRGNLGKNISRGIRPMLSQIPAVSLVACPTHPNSISWSGDNLLAVASGHLITILNPAMLNGPRGLITLPPNKPFSIGVVERGDPSSSCLLPICLSRGTQSCARSISWSPPGLAQNSGCILSVCTTKGRVKLYCFPYYELCIEWTEVVDISDILWDYFSESKLYPPSSNRIHEVDELQSMKECEVGGIRKKNHPVITAREYATQSALLTSVCCAWSPVLHTFSECNLNPTNHFPVKCAILAVGAKSGHISFWRIDKLQTCSNQEEKVSCKPMLVGFLQTHCSFVSAISWGESRADSSNPHLVLVTGSSDGSVNIWVGDVRELVSSSKVDKSCFSLLQELTPATGSPVSIISVAVPDVALDKIVLAVGNGSGSLEAWTCYISKRKIKNSGICYAHDKVVTGLEWAFNGGCLYSCGQDGSMRIWALHGSSLRELPFCSSSLGFKSQSNVIRLPDPCFGLALSPGNLLLSFVRGLDSNLLNPMYQARTHKAAIEFLWTGGNKEVFSEKVLDYNIYESIGFSNMELMCWEANILHSLKKYENVDTELILWDTLTTLMDIKKSSPKFVEDILCKFFSSWLLNLPPNSPIEDVLFRVRNLLQKLDTRKLHLINIICRRLMLVETLPGGWSGIEHEINDLKNHSAKELCLWKELLTKSERELNERRLALFFKSYLHKPSGLSACDWVSSAVIQMKGSIDKDDLLISDELKLLVSKTRLGSRSFMEESCSFCSATVPFETPEYGFCRGVEGVNGPNKIHKLNRCSVSMKICSITSSHWACICCHRMAERFLPESFFTMPNTKSLLDVTSAEVTDLDFECSKSKPSCLFCGILLRRSGPDFFLSSSPA